MDVERDSPFTAALHAACARINEAICPKRYHGPIRGILVLPKDEFERLRKRMLPEEFGRWFWTRPGFEKPDDRRWLMIGGVRIASEEVFADLMASTPICPSVRPPTEPLPRDLAPAPPPQDVPPSSTIDPENLPF